MRNKYLLLSFILLLTVIILIPLLKALLFDIPLNNYGIRPIIPSDEYLISALGLHEFNWQIWAIEKFLERGDNPEVIELLENAASTDYECTKAGALFVLFKFRINPEERLDVLTNMIIENKGYCAFDLFVRAFSPEDATYADIIVQYLKSVEDKDFQIAGRSALHLMGWTFDEIAELGLKSISEYPDEPYFKDISKSSE